MESHGHPLLSPLLPPKFTNNKTRPKLRRRINLKGNNPKVEKIP